MMRALMALALALGVLVVHSAQRDVVSPAPAFAADGADPPPARLAQADYPAPPRVIIIGLIRPPALISPFPIVRIVGRATRRGARIRLLSVRAPVNTTITVLCRRGGCDRFLERQGRGIGRPVRFRRFERRLRAGTLIEVMVERFDAVGKYTRFRIRAGRAPRRLDQCLLFGESAGSECPDA